MRRFEFGAFLLLGPLLAAAQDFKDLEGKIKDFTLSNGARFVIAERHDAPVVALRIQVGAGSANDPAGATGVAHMVERLAVLGTETIGTRDAAAEKKALDAVEDAYAQLDAERAKEPLANEVKLLSLQLEVQKALDIARGYALPGEFRRIMDENGTVGWSSSATADATEYHCTIPSNRLELWFLLTSQRLAHPSFREFYRERDAAVEEQRRIESVPQNRVLQALAATAFTAHPYRVPATGWSSDLAELRMSDARQFFNRYYVPGNVTIALAGDVNPEEAKRLAERYFGPIPARPLPQPIRTKEPPQAGPRTVRIENAVQSFLAVGFKRPDAFDRDDAALDIVQMILAGGRAAWLQKELVETKRLAAGVQAQSSFPGGRYPHLFTILLAPAGGRTLEENDKELETVLARLRNQKVDEAALERAREQARLAMVRRVGDNAGLAAVLAVFTAQYGDWRKLLTVMDDYRKVTADQVQIAALKYLIPAAKTSVYMTPPPPAAAPARGDLE